MKFEINKMYRVNAISYSFNVFVVSRTNCYITIHYLGKTVKLKIRNKFFGNMEFLQVPIFDTSVFCLAKNGVC